MIFGPISSKELLTKNFNARVPEDLDYDPNYNLRSQDKVLCLSPNKPLEVVQYQFGMIPSGSKGDVSVESVAIVKGLPKLKF